MHFLANVHVTCEVCKGKRFNDATLRVRWKGKSIAEVLSTTVAEALELFANQPHDRRTSCATLDDVGPRLSAARAAGDDAVGRRGAAHQAVARAGEEARPGARSTSSTSRPRACTSRDIQRLMEVLDRLVDAGNTVLVDRAQPRRHQARRLGHRPRPRGRRARRRDHRDRHARRGRQGGRSYTGQFLKGLLPRSRRLA